MQAGHIERPSPTNTVAYLYGELAVFLALSITIRRPLAGLWLLRPSRPRAWHPGEDVGRDQACGRWRRSAPVSRKAGHTRPRARRQRPAGHTRLRPRTHMRARTPAPASSMQPAVPNRTTKKGEAAERRAPVPLRTARSATDWARATRTGARRGTLRAASEQSRARLCSAARAAAPEGASISSSGVRAGKQSCSLEPEPAPGPARGPAGTGSGPGPGPGTGRALARRGAAVVVCT